MFGCQDKHTLLGSLRRRNIKYFLETTNYRVTTLNVKTKVGKLLGHKVKPVNISFSTV